MGQMCMTDAGTTQDNFFPPAPPVGELPISQDWLDRMNLVHDHTPVIMLSGKNILAETMFKNHYRVHQPWHETTPVQTWQQSLRFFFLPLMPI